MIDLRGDPRVRVVSRAARGVLAHLVAEAQGRGFVPYVNHHSGLESVAVIAWREGDGAAAQAVGSEVEELLAAELVAFDEAARRIVLLDTSPGFPARGRAAGEDATSPPVLPPPQSSRAPGRPRASTGPRSRGAVTAARVYFERRERQWRDVPAGVTFEAWCASPEGAAWLAGGCSSELQQVAAGNCSRLQQAIAAASSPPSDSPSSSKIPDLKEEEDARTGEPRKELQQVAAGNCSSELQQGVAAVAAAAPRDNPLEVLARASKGRVSPFASARDQVALGLALGDCGLSGRADLEAFGRALAGNGAALLWPKSEPAKARGALTCGFFLGRSGDARMLADGVTRWREGLAVEARPAVAKALPPEDLAARVAESVAAARAAKEARAARAVGVSSGGR